MTRRDETPPSGIAAWLRAEIDRRGITDEAFAERSGMTKSALSNILNRRQVVPKLHTLAGMARALDMSLGRLIEVCGYTMDGEDDAITCKDEQICLMVQQVPELRGLVEHLVALPSDALEQIAQYVNYYLHTHPNRHSGD